MNTLGEFKCLRCGCVHIGISLNDAEEEVRQAQAFYVVASKINNVATRGRYAYLEAYKRCSQCGGPAAEFVPVRDCHMPISSLPLAEVVAPERSAFRDLQLTYEQNFEVWAYMARCNDAGAPWDTISLDCSGTC